MKYPDRGGRTRSSKRKSKSDFNKPVPSSTFVDRDICSIAADTEQFVPTAEQAVRMHKRMAGMP